MVQEKENVFEVQTDVVPDNVLLIVEAKVTD